MGKPLLTDDIIEQAKRGEIEMDEYAHFDEESYDGQDFEVPVNGSDYKSRRLENARRNQFQKKLNRLLFWVVVLLIILFIAIFYF